MPDPTPVYRFAPSPNGELHLGHAFSAILNFELAHRSGGRFLLRIEDIDRGRTRPEFIEGIYRDLAWLGLEWEEPVRVQSDHFGTYRAALSRLEQMDLLYPCFASRKEISDARSDKLEPRFDPDGAPLYPGIHKGMSAEEINERRANGEAYALRLNMEKAILHLRERNLLPLTFSELSETGDRRTVECNPARWGDVVIARKDTPTSYHLAVVVDDAIQKVSHIVRGLDLQPSTDIHRLLQVFLELSEPVYHHHRLIEDDTRKKLSKSRTSKSLRLLREEGVSPKDIWNSLGFRYR